MILGITGGVGSGKSTVLKYLKDKYNAKIIEADAVAKDIMNPGHRVYNMVLSEFNNIKLNEDKTIDRNYLAREVFGNESNLEKLNAIVHPGVKEEILSLISKYYNENEHALIVIEAALLIETGYKDICDEIWYVYCEKEERIKRLISSRGYTRQKACDIMNNQMSEEEFKKSTDEFIDNSFNEEKTEIQIDSLFKKKRII